MSVCQHCYEQQFQKHCHVYTTQFVFVTKLDLCIQALLQNHILAVKKTTSTPCVHLVKSKSDQNNTLKRTKLHQSFKKFLGEQATKVVGTQ